MNEEEFMEQKASEMTVKELFDSILIKLEGEYKEIAKEPKQEFPIVFESNEPERRFEVTSDGIIWLRKSFRGDVIFNGTLPALYKAVAKSKEIRGVEDE